jgi:exonuclease SbcC
MLSRLFKSRARFDDPDPEVRRASVLAISDEEAKNFQDDFAELARADADVGVRRAALSKLLEGKRLEPFLKDADPDIVRAAAEAIARDIDAAALLHHPEVRSAAIRIARDPESISRLIGDVAYDHELIRLAIDSRSPKVRIAVADKLMKEASLVELEHLSRDKDKNVNRLARSRLEEIKHARAELDKAVRRAEELTRTVETQLKAETDPLFTARLGVVKHDWLANRERHIAATRQLASHGVAVDDLTDLSRRFEVGVERMDALAASLTPAPAPTSPPAENAAAAAASHAHAPVAASSAEATFAEALKGLEDLLAAIRRGERDGFAEIDAIHIDSRTLQDHWLAAADHRPPPEHLAARFHAVTHSLSLLYEAAGRLAGHSDELTQAEAAAPAAAVAESPEEFEALWGEQRRARQATERVARTLERIGWPTDLPRPARLRAADQLRTRLAEFDSQCHALHEQLLQRLHDVIAKLETQIEAGNLASAAGLEGEGKRLLHSLPAGTAKRVQGEFAALSARVQELKDWRTFATHPKREQFLSDMEKLAADPLEPAVQAERIRELRQAWKDLGPITNHNDRRLFDRFNHAAEIAFKPCREYFDAQAATRKFNLDQRRKICVDLEGYLDKTNWEHADWRAAERILYAAREEWRKYHPVDRSPGRKLDTQFDALTARLHGKLKTEWDRNAALKQAIVTEATAIQAGGLEPREAIDKIKALQQRWRNVGIVPRRIDQRLWKDFRAACDVVFGQREAARTEQRHAVESQLAQAEQLCDEFQRAVEGATSETAQAGLLTEFNARFDALADLPRDAARRIEQRFRDIERSYRMLLRQAQHDAVMRGVDRLYDIDVALAQLEQSQASGTVGDAEVTGRLAAIEALSLERPGPFAERVKALLRGDAQALRAAAASTNANRHRLAIEMEIAAGLDTPAEYQQERLAFQVERLNQGMKHRRVMEEAPMQIAERWCKTGPVTHDESAVRERFFRACRTALE